MDRKSTIYEDFQDEKNVHTVFPGNLRVIDNSSESLKNYTPFAD